MTSLPFDVETRREKGHPFYTESKWDPTIQSQLLYIHQSLRWGRYNPCYCYLSQLATTLNTYLISQSRESSKAKSKNLPPSTKKEAIVVNLYDQATKIVERL